MYMLSWLSLLKGGGKEGKHDLLHDSLWHEPE